MSDVTPVIPTDAARKAILDQVTTANPHASNAHNMVDQIIEDISRDHVDEIEELVSEGNVPEDDNITREYRDGTIVIVTIFKGGRVIEHTMDAADELP